MVTIGRKRRTFAIKAAPRPSFRKLETVPERLTELVTGTLTAGLAPEIAGIILNTCCGCLGGCFCYMIDLISAWTAIRECELVNSRDIHTV